jgi:hypothetical protein
MGKYVRGLDYMELEGGGRGSGGGGGMGRAMEKHGPMALLAGSGAAGYADYKSTKNRQQEEREAAAEMKRESRGVQKTSSDRAREALAEESMQRKVNKAAEDASKNMAKGGTASSRADGIAQRGKTKGTMVMCGGGMTKRK